MSRKTRKLIWSAPLVAVLAVVGALAIFAAQAPNVALAHDPPGAVTGLTLEVVSSMEVKLTWTAPTTGGAVDSYRIDKSDDGLVWMLLTDTVSGDSTTYTDDTLEFTGVRFYRVFGVNSSGTGAVSEAEGAQTEASTQPGRVTGLRAAAAPGNAGRKEIVLTWRAPATTGGSPIEKYHVYYTTPDALAFEDRGTDATGPTITGTTRIIVTEDASLTYTHKMLTHTDPATDLSPNTSYRYRVYAVNKAEQVSAMASDTRSATTKKVGPPDAPTGLTAVATGTSGQIQLYWYHPADDGGQDITNFRIHQRSGTQTWPDPDTDATDDQVDNVEAKTSPGVVEATMSLTDGTSYQFRVYSVTGTDPNFVFSNAYAGTVSATPVGTQAVPDAPTFTGTRDAKGVVTLNWTRATDVLSYRIDVSDDGEEWNKLIESTGFTDAQYTYKDPKRGDGVERHYRMFARNRHGYSSSSAAVTVGVEAATPPGMVRGLTATPDPNDPTKINL
ncbi:MAG: fibronectin type III domain-containing protein, partial [Chloroflexota bacterium]|nr:fibronectin type III domain-containing protein [Chloroflexota bacterium]